jgi:FAD:protein FMN transferase
VTTFPPRVLTQGQASAGPTSADTVRCAGEVKHTRMIRLAAIVSLVLASACTDRSGPAADPHTDRLVERAFVSMGTELRLAASTGDEARAATAFDAVFAEFERLDRLMSVWHEDSDIARLNAAAGMQSVEVSPEVLEVLYAARRISELSDGKFDVTFGALSGLWRFDHDQDNRIPSRSAVSERLPLVDYRQLEIQGHTAFLGRQGMRAHLGGIGKGYALDRAAAILREHGLRDFLIQSGGDLYAAGQRDGRPWRIGIRDPRGPEDRSFAVVESADTAISTSGDYERFFIQDGRRYHHLLDPSTGEPATGCRSVTVLAARAVDADALSTAVFIAGPEAGMRLIEGLPGMEAVVVTAHNEVLVSSGLRQRLVMLTPPTDGL